MEISLTGIEQAVEGLEYRSDKSPKSRLIQTLKNHYSDFDAVEAVSILDGDALINLMWDLGGDKNAIKSKRKNLSSIKSSVNADLKAAWELGCNPEGITIGTQNNFVMSDAAKDKILSSFSGAMDLDGGNSLDRVTEALKIVSDYLSNLPGGLENDKLSNLKSLVEGLAGKFRDGGAGEFELTETRTDSAEVDGAEEVLEEDTETEGIADDVIEDDLVTPESDDTEIIEVMDEGHISDDSDEVEYVDEDEIIEDADDEEELLEEDTEIEEIADEVIEGDSYAEDFDVDEPGEIELLDDDEEILGDAGDEPEPLLDVTEMEEIVEGELTDSEAEIEDGGIEDEIDDLEALGPDNTEIIEVMEEGSPLGEPDEVELVDEDEVLEDVGDEEEILGDDTEVEEIDEANMDDIDEVIEEDAAEFEGEGLNDIEELIEEEDNNLEEDDVVEMMGEADVSDLDEVDIVEDEDALEEVDEAESAEAEDDTESDDERQPDDIGLPLDQLSEEALNFDEFEPDEEQKRLLAERFDGYLGAMERFYNQYIIITKGRYTVGSDETEGDALKERKVSFPDYYVGKYPVTNALFEVFIERTGYKTSAEKHGFGYVYQGRFQKTVDPITGLSQSVWNSSYTRKKVDGATWYQPKGPGSTLHQKRNHPVVQISIKDARTFAAWTGKRLPTEIEWEAAARSQSGLIFPWGNDWQDGCCNFENSNKSDTCPVDEHAQGINEAGLADLLGNVLEWTADECEPKYPMERPTRFFIAKGGSWVNHEQTHLYDRTRFEAEFTANIVGFRCLAD